MNIKGLWIPLEVLKDKNLGRTEKEAYSLILCLCQKNKCCYLSNSVLKDYLNISLRQASRIITFLNDKKYIKVKLIRKEDSNEIQKRIITPLKKYYLPIVINDNRVVSSRLISHDKNGADNKDFNKIYNKYIENNFFKSDIKEEDIYSKYCLESLYDN